MQLAAAQQYSFTLKGYAPLYDWAKAHAWRMHAPPGGHDVMITNGNNQTIEARAALLKCTVVTTQVFGPPHPVVWLAQRHRCITQDRGKTMLAGHQQAITMLS